MNLRDIIVKADIQETKDTLVAMKRWLDLNLANLSVSDYRTIRRLTEQLEIKKQLSTDATCKRLR
jgi:hypothetical protein